MELYNKKENPNLKPEDGPVSDLHDEGIDLVGTGVNEDNEFTDGSVNTTPVFIPPEPVPEPAMPAPAPTPIPASAPIPAFTPSSVPSPASKPEQKAVAAEPSVSKEQAISAHNDPSIKPLRTFKTDAEEAVRYKNISAVDIAVAEQKKREANPIEYIEEKQSHPGGIIGAVLLLIVLLIGGWFYWFKTTGTSEPEANIPVASVETIIPYAKGSTLVIYPDSDPLILAGAKLSASNPGLGNIYALIPTLTATSTEAAPVAEFFRETHIPSRLSRSLAPEYMVGSYAVDAVSPFLILKDTFFQNAFAGMLEWEKDLRNDFLPLIHVTYPDEASVSTDSDKFEDIVVSNIDTRVLRNSDGRIILAYAFADPETIVISTSETALEYVLDRLLTVRSVQ